MKQLIIDCLEKDWDREFLYSIKEFDVEIVVEQVVNNYENPTINELIYEAIQRHIQIVLNKKDWNYLYEDLGIKSVTDFDEYINIWVNGLDSKVTFSEDRFRHHFGVDFIENKYERETVISDLSDLIYEIENFRR